MKVIIDRELISKRFKYTEESARCLIWLEDVKENSRVLKRMKSNRAGCINGAGYWIVGLNGKLYSVHRLVWTIIHGDIPEGLVINHINCNRSDNRINNLELVTSRQNSRRSKINKNGELSTINTSGVNGIQEEKTWNGTKTKLNYYARVCWKGYDFKLNRKSFAYSKYGKEEAWRLAIEFNNQIRKSVDKQVDEEVIKLREAI